MAKRFGFFHPIMVFILAQLAWLSLLGLWIYWFVTNYVILKQVGEKLSPQFTSKSHNVLALVGGLILLVFILGGMYFIFIYLAKQINITRLYDYFIANVTHELKSPLASIQLYLETLSSRKVSPERQRAFIALMMKDTNRLKNLIDSILDISIIEQKKMAYNYHVLDIEPLIRELREGALDQFKLPGETIGISGSAPCQGVIDRDAFKIVFDNLVDNAIKYTVGQVQVTVRISCSEKEILIEFSDRGIGIRREHLQKIFNKFYRVYDADSPNIKGTGLGLYMVKEIIRYHGGTITVSSKGKNAGTTFRITLPVFGHTKKKYLNRLLKRTRRIENQPDFKHDQR